MYFDKGERVNHESNDRVHSLTPMNSEWLHTYQYLQQLFLRHVNSHSIERDVDNSLRSADQP